MRTLLFCYAVLYFLAAPEFLGAQSWTPKSTVESSPTSTLRKTVTFITVRCRKGDQPFDTEGTGFFVSYPDKRLGEDQGFTYLVTNRHVALCYENGHNYRVERVSIRLNLRLPSQGQYSETIVLKEHGNVPWLLSADDSVDLAILPFLPPEERYDYLVIPMDTFATKDVVERQGISEGDRVLFTGLFYRLPGEHKMTPIIREGMLAMLPEEKIKTIMGIPGRIYLADFHVIKGNSGSPVVVSIGGVRQGTFVVAERLLLLGVVSGYFYEDEDLNLEIGGWPVLMFS